MPSMATPMGQGALPMDRSMQRVLASTYSRIRHAFMIQQIDSIMSRSPFFCFNTVQNELIQDIVFCSSSSLVPYRARCSGLPDWTPCSKASPHALSTFISHRWIYQHIWSKGIFGSFLIISCFLLRVTGSLSILGSINMSRYLKSSSSNYWFSFTLRMKSSSYSFMSQFGWASWNFYAFIRRQQRWLGVSPNRVAGWYNFLSLVFTSGIGIGGYGSGSTLAILRVLPQNYEISSSFFTSSCSLIFFVDSSCLAQDYFCCSMMLFWMVILSLGFF